jgi:hypothetical protein
VSAAPSEKDIELARQGRIERAHRANELLENPIAKRVLEEMEADMLAAWRKTEPGDTDGRELAYHRLAALDEFCTRLRNIVQDGTVASEELRRNTLSIDQRRRHGGTDRSANV